MKLSKLHVCLFAGIFLFGCSGKGTSPSSDDDTLSEESSSSLLDQSPSSDSLEENYSSTEEDESSSSVDDETESSSSEESSSSSLEHYAWQFLNENLSYGELVDERDGQVYKTIKFGELTWMAENLNYSADFYSSRYRDGLGMFYNAYSNKEYQDSLCPRGWRVPTAAEWSAAMSSGKDLLAANAWRLREDSTKFSENDNASGLTILPGGSVCGSWKYDYDDSQEAEFFTSKVDSSWDYHNGGYQHAVRYAHVQSSLNSDGRYTMSTHSMPGFSQALYIRCVKDPEGYDFIAYTEEEMSAQVCDESNKDMVAYDASDYVKRVCTVNDEGEEPVWYWSREVLKWEDDAEDDAEDEEL